MPPTIITHQSTLSQDLSTTGGSIRKAIVRREETEQLARLVFGGLNNLRQRKRDSRWRVQDFFDYGSTFDAYVKNFEFSPKFWIAARGSHAHGHETPSWLRNLRGAQFDVFFKTTAATSAQMTYHQLSHGSTTQNALRIQRHLGNATP